MTNDEITNLIDLIVHALAEGENVALHLADALDAVVTVHEPHKIYDECEHEHAYDDPAAIDLADFVTCEEAYQYDICKACCTGGFDNDQTEDCATDHKHGPGKFICPTMAAIGKALGEKDPC